MDHLPQHENHGDKHIKVPLFIVPRTFKPEEFFSLPDKFNLENATDVLKDGPTSRISQRKYSEFLQEWLFFALLAQFLGIEIDACRFREEGINKSYLSTLKLPRLLKEWEDRTDPEKTDHLKETKRQIRVALALSDARRFINKWLSDRSLKKSKFMLQHNIDGDTASDNQASDDQNNSSKRRDFDSCLGLSFMILGETLDKALHKVRLRRERLEKLGKIKNRGALQYWDTDGSERKSWGISRYLTNRMVDKGWCKKEIRRIHMTMGDVSSVYFAHLFPRKSSTSGQHQNCSFHECLVPHPPMEDVHHTIDCVRTSNTCSPHAALDNDKIIDIIQGGKIPLLRFNGSMNLEILDYDPEIPCGGNGTSQPRFGAISHVWSDGLGNYHGRNLPWCQLKRIQEAFRKIPKPLDIYKSEDDTEDDDLPFWIDTLCIPDQWEIKKKAICNIRKVYECAAAVVVLDPEYLDTPSKSPTLEAVVRINTGRWTQRLWTLQEGVLSKNLFFEFKGGLLSSTDLEKLYSDANSVSLNSKDHYVYRAGWLFSPAMRSLQKRETQHRVANVWRAVQWRTTSKAIDETICLATLLGINPQPLLNIDPNKMEIEEVLRERMKVFLFQLDCHIGIPPGMIFLPGPKLKSEGYGWAPRTWMFEQSQELLFALFPQINRTTFLTLRGLHVQYPGVVIDPPTEAPSQRFWLPVSQRLHEWYRVDYINDEGLVWKDLWARACSRDRRPAIILGQGERRNISEIALLVEDVTVREENQNAMAEHGKIVLESVRWVNILCRVKVRLETDQKAIRDLINNYRKNPDEMMWGERLLDDQRWCVDGT